jgi:hypothetical protein
MKNVANLSFHLERDHLKLVLGTLSNSNGRFWKTLKIAPVETRIN